jgi:type IV secretory pathway VirB4 component
MAIYLRNFEFNEGGIKMEQALKKQDEEEIEEEEQVVYDLLMDSWEAKCEKLIEEENGLQVELEKLEKEQEQSAINEAKIGVLSREAEALLAVMDADGWEKKRAEIEKVKQRQREVVNLISKGGERLKVIGAEKTRIANEVLTNVYPEIQARCLAEEEALINFLESVLKDLHEFAGETGATVRQVYREGLVPMPIGKTRALRGRFDEFFS